MRAHGSCFYCEAALAPKSEILCSAARTTDHVIPRSAVRRVSWLFRPHWHALNTVPACQSCNLRKAALSPLEWLPMVPTIEGRERLAERLADLGTPAARIRMALDGISTP